MALTGLEPRIPSMRAAKDLAATGIGSFVFIHTYRPIDLSLYGFLGE